MKLFLFGILFCAIVLPILDGVQDITAQTVQFLCAKVALKTAKINAELIKYADAQDQGDERNPIGFAVSTISSDQIGGDEEEDPDEQQE